MQECIFCKIANDQGKKFDYQSDNFVVFADIHPSAPIHLLIVPKVHYKDITEAPDDLWIEAKHVAIELQKQLNQNGFRLAVNTGDKVAVEHMHIHFMSGFGKERAV